MAQSKKQAKKSSKPKVSGWSAALDKAFKKLKKAGVFAKTAIAGTKGTFNKVKELLGAGYTEGKSVWLSIPGNKEERKARAAEYSKAGYTVKNGKVMMQKMASKDTLRMDKKTGQVNRYATDVRTGKRRKYSIPMSRDASDLPPLGEGEKYIVYFRKGRGKTVEYYPRWYDSLERMTEDMDSMYQRYVNWQSHVEIMH